MKKDRPRFAHTVAAASALCSYYASFRVSVSRHSFPLCLPSLVHYQAAHLGPRNLQGESRRLGRHEVVFYAIDSVSSPCCESTEELIVQASQRLALERAPS